MLNETLWGFTFLLFRSYLLNNERSDIYVNVRTKNIMIKTPIFLKKKSNANIYKNRKKTELQLIACLK